MKQRVHVLHEKLKGFVHRKEISELKEFLPPLTEFVLMVRLSPVQKQLYKEVLKTVKTPIFIHT
jgi:transcriptional regulator ATRX